MTDKTIAVKTKSPSRESGTRKSASSAKPKKGKTASMFKPSEVLRMEEELLDCMTEGVTMLSEKGNVLFINKSAEAQFGRNKRSLVGRHIKNLVKAIEDQEDYLPWLHKSFNGKLPNPGEYRIRFTNKQEPWFYLNFSLKEDPTGTAKRLMVVHRDVSQQKVIEEKLKSSKRKLSHLIESFAEIVINVDHRGKILFVHQDSKNLVPKKVVGKKIYDLMLPEDHKAAKTAIARVFESGEEHNYEASGIGSDGIVRWYSTRVSPVKHDNQVIAATLNSRDNSEKREAEVELRNAKTILESVFRSVPGVLLVIDRRLNIVAGNWQGLHDFNPEIKGRKIKCYEGYWKRNEPCQNCQTMDVFECAEASSHEVFDVNDQRHKEIRTVPVIDDFGAVTYVIEHIEDVTLRKKQEENHVLTDKKTEAAHKIKSDFLSRISHELKTPMIGILGFAKLGMDRYKRTKKTKLQEYFCTIYESGEKLQRLLNNLLDLSQLEVGAVGYDFQREKLSMVTTIILNDMFLMLKKNNIAVNFRKPSFPDYVTMDVDKIGKVMRNLLTNAIKISEPGSKIKIEISEKEDQVLFSVQDTGQGISQSELKSLFEKFKRGNSDKDSSGLGLAISYKIITDHNGKIWAENIKSGGSVFKFQLPKASTTP